MRRALAGVSLAAAAVAALVVIVGVGGGHSSHRRAAALTWPRPAAPSALWDRHDAALQRAVSSFMT